MLRLKSQAFLEQEDVVDDFVLFIFEKMFREVPEHIDLWDDIWLAML